MKKNKFIFKEISNICFCIILLLIVMIVLKAKPSLKESFYKEVYEKNISFSTLNSLYKQYLGDELPFSDFFNKQSEMVFNEKIEYSVANKYKDGVMLTVNSNYLVPVIESGLIIFIGEKEGYGNTVIVQQANGIDVWYSNIFNVTVNMYDYVEQGSLLGEVIDNHIYLIFKKEGEVLNYQDYI